MGDKQPSVRTLPSGEKIVYHPDGREVLVPVNLLSQDLDGQNAVDTRSWLDAEKTHHRVVAVEEKRAQQQEGNAIPSDKSPL